jgi:hypothetical protein
MRSGPFAVDSAMMRFAVLSRLMSVARNSVERTARDSTEAMMMVAMNTPAILTPSGRSMMLSIVV